METPNLTSVTARCLVAVPAEDMARNRANWRLFLSTEDGVGPGDLVAIVRKVQHG